jgi:hypothetical protein
VALGGHWHPHGVWRELHLLRRASTAEYETTPDIQVHSLLTSGNPDLIGLPLGAQG